MTNESRKIQLAPEVDAGAVRPGVEAVKQAVGEIGQAAQRAGEQGAQGMAKLGDAAKKVGEGFDEFVGPPTREAAKQVEQATKSIVASIERTTAALKAGQKGGAEYYEELARQRGVSGEAIKPYVEQLRAAEAAQKAASQGLGKMQVSAAQTSAALRQVPAQFTDIITSLQGGQAPLTVLLQQGGQLKDAFGGVGAAAKALGGYILSLVNPFTVAAAAAGVLGLAYFEGAKESQAFERSLILSGNQAGLTASSLQSMARAQSAVVGTQGAAAESLAKLAETGRVSALAIDSAAEAVTRFSRVGGSVDDTVKKFERLGKDPLKAVIELNEAENFLTVGIYKQVKALEDQGRTVEAANLAQQTYAAALNGRAQQIEQNLGSIERGWTTIKDAAKAAWDSMLNVGRPQTLANLDQQIAQLERRAQIKAAGNAQDKTEAILIGEQVAALKQQRDAVAEVEREQKKLAAAASTRAVETQKAVQADKDAEKSAKGVSSELDKQRRLVAELAGLSGDFFEEWDRLPKVYKDVDQLTAAQAKLLAKQPAMREQAQAQAAAHKEAAKALEDLMKAEQRRIDAQYKVAEQVGEQIQKLEDEAKAIGVSAAEHVSLAAAIELVRAARLEEAAAKATAAQDYAGAAAIRAEIEARQKLATLLNEKDVRDAAKKSAEDAAKEWKRAGDEIERTLTDSLMRGFESGKSLAQNLRDTVVNLFKTMVLRPSIQATVQPIANSLTGSIGSLLGLPSAGTGGAGGIGVPGGLGSLGGLGSMLGSFGSAFSGGWQLAGSSFGTGLDAISGGWTALVEGSGTLAGNMGQILGAGSQLLGTVGGYVSALKSLTEGKYGAAVGAGLGTFFGGPVGAAIGSAIGSAVDKVFSGGAGTPHMGADYISTATGGYRPAANEVGIYSAGDSVNKNRSQSVEDALKVLTGTGAGLLNSLAASFGKSASYAVGGYFAADGKDPAQANTRITSNGQTISSTATRYNVADPQKGLEAFTAELAGQVRAALAAMDLPAWAKDQLNALANSAGFEELANAVQTIAATRQALQQLVDTLPQLKGTSDEVIAALLKQAGGIDNLRAITTGYFDNFYTDAEKTAIATDQLRAALGSLGFAMPATREAYRALVEAQDKNTEAGRTAWLQLQALGQAFAQLVPATQGLADGSSSAADSVAEAAAKMAEAGRRVLADLADEQGGLQVDLLRAQGELGAAAALERQRAIAKLTEGLSATDAAAAVAAYDFNAALREQIQTMNAAASAAQQAAQAQAAVAQQRAGLQDQLDQLLGNTAALRERELAALDPSNRALQEQIYALQDQQAAAQAAQAQAQQAQQAAQQAAQAAEELRQSWQSVTDSLYAEAQRIRGVLGGNAAQSLAGAKTQFAIVTAQARAGDQAAAQMLPQLSQTLLALAEAQFTNATDLRLLRAQTAASLATTAAQLAGRYGLSMPRLATGTNEVPEDMVAMLHKGEAVVPRAYNPALGGGGTRDRDLLDEVKGLRSDQRTQAAATVQLQQALFKLQKSWDLRGLPPARQVATT